MIDFKNTYTHLPRSFYQEILPEQFSNPKIVEFNHELAKDLNIQFEKKSKTDLANIFSGQKILDGSHPIALAYAGFQFGHPVPQLGDGRAVLLGETQGLDIQLKGSGRTQFSRRGDGRSALGPVLREYIVSEAMHTLGVPTTRALAVVTTGEEVYRQDGAEPGGIFTRVASSHLRVGTFQYFAFKQDLESLKTLLDYTIKRHYFELKELDTYREKSLEILKSLIKKQSDLIAKWSSLGFIHGVMNTDNFSLAGITIDYGPCAFMDEFKFNKVFSSIDQKGRYAFWNQVPIAQWNILRLADCLLPLISEDEKQAVSLVEKELLPIMNSFEEKRIIAFSEKLGLQKDNERLVMDFLNYLEQEHLDFTLAFRNLPELLEDQSEFFPKTEALESFIQQWKSLSPEVEKLSKINPLYIPRNHQIQNAIELAYKGDYSYFYKLNEVLSSPFKTQDKNESFALPPKPQERVYQTFCGT